MGVIENMIIGVFVFGVVVFGMVNFYSHAANDLNVSANTTEFDRYSASIENQTDYFDSMQSQMKTNIDNNQSNLQTITILDVAYLALGNIWVAVQLTFNAATYLPMLIRQSIGILPVGIPSYVSGAIGSIVMIVITFAIINFYQARKEL